jgi:hypothetical protein
MRCVSAYSSDVGTSLVNSLPQLVTGQTSLVTATYGQEQYLNPGSQQLTGSTEYKGGTQLPIQMAPPIDWFPILAVSGGLILLSIYFSRQ